MVFHIVPLTFALPDKTTSHFQVAETPQVHHETAGNGGKTPSLLTTVRVWNEEPS